MPRRYPLEPLAGLRKEKSEKRAAELREAQAKSEKERLRLEAAQERRTRAEAAGAAVRAGEQARLEQGGQSARDLQQGERFRAGVTAQLAELGALEHEAQRRAQEAALAAERARTSLGVARAEQRAVERHRERFRSNEERAREEAEQEAAEERWSAQKRGARGD